MEQDGRMVVILTAEEVASLSALDWALSNLATSQYVQRVIVAVAHQRHELAVPVKALIERTGSECFVGCDDVLERLLQVCEMNGLSRFVKVHLSSPYLNILLLDRMIDTAQKSEADYVYVSETAPDQHAEVISITCLHAAIEVLGEAAMTTRRISHVLPLLPPSLKIVHYRPFPYEGEVVVALCPDTNRRETIINYYRLILGRSPTLGEFLDMYHGQTSLVDIWSDLQDQAKAQLVQQRQLFDWITDNMAVGPAPTIGLADTLVDSDGITAFVNVADQEFPYKACLPSDIHYAWFPMVDGALIPKQSLLSAVRSVAQLCSLGHKVYLHCHAGISRSACVAAIFLALTEGLSYGEAVARVRARRAVCSPHPNLIDIDSVMYVCQQWSDDHR